MRQDPVPKARPIIKQKKGGIETLLIIVLVLLLIVVAVGGAGLLGVIHIPGITPAKKNMPPRSAMSKINKASLAPSFTKKSPKLTHKSNIHTPSKLTYQATPPTAHPAPAPVLKQPPTTHPSASPQPPKTDPTLGAKKIATLWDQMETKELVVIVKNWNNLELAEVIMQMSPSKASALLSALNPKRASQISKIIQQEGSIVNHP